MAWSEKRLRELMTDAEQCPRLSHFDKSFCVSQRARMALKDFTVTEKQSECLVKIENKVYAT